MTNEIVKRNQGEVDNFRQFADAARVKQNFDGTILKYTKGNWTAGKDGIDMNGAQIVALVDRLAVGWTKWLDRRPVDYRVGYVAEGFRPPRRQELDMVDETTWPRDFNGDVRDPWQFGLHLPLADLETTEQYIFSTSSSGGREAIASLADAYANHRAQGKTTLPLVELNTDSYDHRSYGQVNVPKLDILKWIDPPEFEQKALPGSPMEGSGTASVTQPTAPQRARIARRSSSDMDDEIPFAFMLAPILIGLLSSGLFL